MRRKLGVELDRDIRLAAQRRATLRRANQREVDARFRKTFPQEAVLDLLQRGQAAPEADDLLLPRTFEQRASVLDALDREMISDELKRGGIVEIEEKSDLLRLGPPPKLGLRHRRQVVEITPQFGGKSFERLVVHHAIRNLRPQHLRPARMAVVEGGSAVEKSGA